MPRDSFPFEFARAVRSVHADTGVWFIFQTAWNAVDVRPETPRGQNFRWSNENYRPSQTVWNSIIFIAVLSKITPQTNRRFFIEKNVWSFFPICITHSSPMLTVVCFGFGGVWMIRTRATDVRMVLYFREQRLYFPGTNHRKFIIIGWCFLSF